MSGPVLKIILLQIKLNDKILKDYKVTRISDESCGYTLKQYGNNIIDTNSELFGSHSDLEAIDLDIVVTARQTPNGRVVNFDNDIQLSELLGLLPSIGSYISFSFRPTNRSSPGSRTVEVDGKKNAFTILQEGMRGSGLGLPNKMYPDKIGGHRGDYQLHDHIVDIFVKNDIYFLDRQLGRSCIAI